MRPLCSLRLRPSARRLFAAGLGLFLFAASTSHAFIEIYAKFADATGAYQGELTTPANYTGWSLVYSASFGVSNNITFDSLSSGTPTALKVTPQGFSLVRATDRISPTLFLDVCSGVTIGSAKNTGLTIDYYSFDTNTVPLRLEFKGVFVNSQSASSSGDSLPTESVSFVYTSMRMTVLGNDGKAVVTSWNFANGTATY